MVRGGGVVGTGVQGRREYRGVHGVQWCTRVTVQAAREAI